MKGPRWCLKSLPSSPSTPPVLPWNPPQKPRTSCLPVAALARRRAASTASAPPEKSWMRVSPSGMRPASSERNRARVSVVKLPNVRRSSCLHRFHVMGMTVAHAAHADAGDEVDVLVAVLVDQPAVFATRHRHAGVEGEGLQPGSDVALLPGHDLTRPRSDLAARGHRVAPAKRSATCAAMRSAA